jgi:putative ABC transport system permease protein
VVWLSGIGLCLGSAGAFVLARLMAAGLFGVVRPEAALPAALAVGLLGLALLAGYVPARRALHVDPVTTLRAE